MGIGLLAFSVLINPPPIVVELFGNINVSAASETKSTPSFSSQYPSFKIVINIPATELRLYEDGELLQTFPIAIGQKIYPTPANKTDSLTQIIWNPWWYPPESEWAKEEKITPPGPNNPLGVVKMPLSDALLMHGTNKERSIGTPASHACIRMFNEDARDLAWILQSSLTARFDPSWLKTYQEKRYQTSWVSLAKPVPVEFIYEPIEIANNQLILHRDVYGKIRDKKEWLVQKLTEHGFTKLDESLLAKILKQWNQAQHANHPLNLGLLQSPPKSGPANRSTPF